MLKLLKFIFVLNLRFCLILRMSAILKSFTIKNYFKIYPLNKYIIFVNSSYSTSSQTVENTLEKSNKKCLRVAVIGVPNAGKSTFINNLINHRVCPTSNKVHTTLRSNKAIHTEKNTQIVLFDTPGLVTNSDIKKYNLGSKFSSSHRDSIQNSDMIAVIHDVSNSWTRSQLHSTVLETLNFYSKVPSFLVLNKIDLLKSKRILLDLVRTLSNNTLSRNRKGIIINKPSTEENDKEITKKNNQLFGWGNFLNIFMVSSITGDGLNEIMKMLLHEAKMAEWQFSAETHTDLTPENIIVESVRARLLDYLPQEIPYKLQTTIEYFTEEKNIIYTSVQIRCPNPRLERLLCGESNGKLKQITERVTSDLVETFNKPISLTITTHVSKAARAAAN